MLVLQKISSDPTVIPFNPRLPLPARITRALRRQYMKLSYGAMDRRPSDASYFSDDRSQYGASIFEQIPQADVLHLHWIAGFVDYREFFVKLPHCLPVVWTLHDMNPFTGGCHFDAGCGNFARSCGECPQLASHRENDLSRDVWMRKHEAFQKVGQERLHIVTPSHWLFHEAKRSSLLGGFCSSVIPYGLDTDAFQPRDREKSRKQFGIPPDAKVVLFIADWAGERRKGLNLLLSAVPALANISGLRIVAVGRGIKREQISSPLLVVDYVTDDFSMSHLYSCAELFVIPSLQDNFPNTALEAISCGTPVVGFNVGGVPEIVRDGVTGTTVPSGDSKALAAAIRQLLEDGSLRAAYSSNCRRIAVEEYSLNIQAKRYAELYERLLPASKTSTL